MGLLKQAHEHRELTKTGQPATSPDPILEVPDEQPYADGTIFHIKDFEAFCMVLMGSYKDMNHNARDASNDIAQVSRFLNQNMKMLDPDESSAKTAARMCM